MQNTSASGFWGTVPKPPTGALPLNPTGEFHPQTP